MLVLAAVFWQGILNYTVRNQNPTAVGESCACRTSAQEAARTTEQQLHRSMAAAAVTPVPAPGWASGSQGQAQEDPLAQGARRGTLGAAGGLGGGGRGEPPLQEPQSQEADAGGQRRAGTGGVSRAEFFAAVAPPTPPPWPLPASMPK